MSRPRLTGFLKTVKAGLAPHGITVNALLPGPHKTAHVDKLIKDRAAQEDKTQEEISRKMASAIPCGSFGAAAAFLASQQARFITGHNLFVDGERYMRTL